jgi:acetolactate synthase I/II/III large subunit
MTMATRCRAIGRGHAAAVTIIGVNGAEAMMLAFQQAGVRACFANPGTTELEMVAALDAAPLIRPVLCAQENVATGAADAYFRVTGVPALTVVHLGPGFANGWTNLHNARRGSSGVINLVGDQASWHLKHDAPLASDIDALAGTLNGWIGRPRSADELVAMAHEAFAVAMSGRIATLIIPQDHAWSEVSITPERFAPSMTATAGVDTSTVDALRRAGSNSCIVLGGAAAREAGCLAAASICAATGAKAYTNLVVGAQDLGRGRPGIGSHPYFPLPAREALDAELVILAGSAAPVTYFGYRDEPSSLLRPNAQIIELAPAGIDATASLQALAAALGDVAPVLVTGPAPTVPNDGPLTHKSVTQVFAAHQTVGMIIVEEGVTAAADWAAAATTAPPFTCLFGGNGGAIGGGPPLAVGAAVAAPDRQVMLLQADGSGLYTIQALWTMARERLDIVVVVLSNRIYRILQVELKRSGLRPEKRSRHLTELSDPAVDWAMVARGFGVSGTTATTVAELDAMLSEALAAGGPHLIEAVIS